jgi:hypothetical protein
VTIVISKSDKNALMVLGQTHTQPGVQAGGCPQISTRRGRIGAFWASQGDFTVADISIAHLILFFIDTFPGNGLFGFNFILFQSGG